MILEVSFLSALHYSGERVLCRALREFVIGAGLE